MPSPFPGMDPYLEAYGPWPDFHQRFVTYLSDALQPLIQPRYHARISERVYVALPNERPIYPDVSLIDTGAWPRDSIAAWVAEESADEPLVLTLSLPEVHEGFVEIVDAKTGARVVTVLELLSPANKAPGSQGHDLYLEKQQEVLSSTAHLVEIDLLRDGTPTIALPKGQLTLGEYDYLVSIARSPTHREFAVYRISIRKRLPRIRVPLAPEDQPVVLDVQSLFDRCYDNGAYGRILNYRQPAPEFLRPEDRQWAESMLKQRGLR